MPSDEPAARPDEEPAPQDTRAAASHESAVDRPTASTPRRQGRANDYLANERTFLAWVRTGVALIALGFVVARFGLFLREIASHIGVTGSAPGAIHFAQVFGVVLVVLAGAILVASYLRYLQTARALDRGVYADERALLAVLAILTVAAALALAIYLAITE